MGHNVGRGRRAAIELSPTPTLDRTSVPPLTQIAIATYHGLRTYVHDTEHRRSPAGRTPVASGGEPIQENDLRPGDFRHLEEDLEMLHNYLLQRGFHEVPRDASYREPVKLSSVLEDEINVYIQQRADDHSADAAPQVRFLILSAHTNHDLARLQIKNSTGMTCRWSRLKNYLHAPPPNVVTVVILDCCASHDGLSMVTEHRNTSSPIELVLMAGAEYRKAQADRYKGSYFLFSLLQALTTAEASGSTLDSWKDLFCLTMMELRNIPSKQDPCFYINTSRNPSFLFHHLAKPGQAPSPPNIGRGRRQGSVQKD
ncbi:hypothetical protein RhiJN_05405 [Ceratobasidium sp. AG-Ba]|nr:hypothetical protein RhiJN_05405 [Ceratobasidium sp. AG-Ba]QRW06321.1 hypothetical protein RhiLY_05320 [Ceratobasidium sp. AG-Ba]